MTPALLTSRSMRSCAARIASAADRTEAWEARSSGTTSAEPSTVARAAVAFS